LSNLYKVEGIWSALFTQYFHNLFRGLGEKGRMGKKVNEINRKRDNEKMRG
jgi:hypothetical protein